MKRSDGPRKAADLPDSLHQRLAMYALAASAAGVSLLALAQPADAKIIYTPANVLLDGKPFPLDLNHDGIVDFFLFRYHEHTSTFANDLLACHRPFVGDRTFCASSTGATNSLNAIRVIESMGRSWATALHRGAKIQRGDRFRNRIAVTLGQVKDLILSTPRWYGPWFNGGKGVTDRYLGIKFKIRPSETHFHYGWARISVTTMSYGFTATLTGYAYETIPSKSIIAGQTKITLDDPTNRLGASLTKPIPDTSQPASLGVLALGARGIPVRRKQVLDAAN
jgi:hypothetical protein